MTALDKENKRHHYTYSVQQFWRHTCLYIPLTSVDHRVVNQNIIKNNSKFESVTFFGTSHNGIY